MKINRLDAHDRLLHFTKQDHSIEDCAEDLMRQQPFGPQPFYAFVHARTDDDGLRKRLIWQPRLTKPKAQTNSMLFKMYPSTQIVKVIWIIPQRELWPQYKIGNVTESKIVLESIDKFINSRAELEAPEPDDLTDEQILKVYQGLHTYRKI